MESKISVDDQNYMIEAIKEGKLAQDKTGENPPVGVVIVKDSNIIGRGHTSMQGGNHAEINALLQAGDNAKEATLYTTLEPCSHYGLTPPCCKAVLEAGIKRVVIGLVDPNLKVNGKGIEYLKRNHVEVLVGFHEEEIKRDLKQYLDRIGVK